MLVCWSEIYSYIWDVERAMKFSLRRRVGQDGLGFTLVSRFSVIVHIINNRWCLLEESAMVLHIIYSEVSLDFICGGV